MTLDRPLGTSLFGMTGLSPASPPAKTLPPRSRRGLRAVIFVLSVALLGLGAGLAYSSNSARAWHDTAVSSATQLGAAQRQRDDVRAQLASTQSQLAATKQELSDLAAQPSVATDPVPPLAGGPAQVGDQAAYLAETVALSDRVSQELGTCVTEVQTFSSYLIQYQGQDKTNRLDFARQVNTDCTLAKTDNATLAQRLATP